MRKIYSLFSFVLISSIAIAQPQGNKKAVDHHELTKKEAVDKAKVVTGYTSLNQVLTAISKHVVKNKSNEKEFLEYIKPFVKADIRFISVSIAEGKITSSNLKQNYAQELKKYKELYKNFEKDGSKKK